MATGECGGCMPLLHDWHVYHVAARRQVVMNHLLCKSDISLGNYIKGLLGVHDRGRR